MAHSLKTFGVRHLNKQGNPDLDFVKASDEVTAKEIFGRDFKGCNLIAVYPANPTLNWPTDKTKDRITIALKRQKRKH